VYQATTSTCTQQQEPLTEIASKFNQAMTLLTTSLNSYALTGHTPTNTNQFVTQESNYESAEVLSDVSDNPPTHPPPATRLMVTGTSISDSSPTTSWTLTVLLPPVTAKLRQKIISGEFSLLLPKAIFSGNHPPESTKSVTVQLNPGNDDLFVRPTQASKKNYHFSILNGGMEHIFSHFSQPLPMHLH